MSRAGRDGVRLAEQLLRLVLPPERREEFIGDLLEEAAARGIAARGFVLRQVLASWPSLLVARLRRPAVVAAAVPAGGAFAAFMVGGRGRGRRSWAITLSVLAHAALGLAALARGAWTVDEVNPPRLLTDPILFRLPPPPGAAPAPRREATRPTPRVRPPVARAITQPSAPPAPAVSPEVTAGGDERTGTQTGPGTGECPAGATCDGPVVEQPKVLPPQVADKSCQSCPLPRLPEAYLRVGTSFDMLVRICVDKDGGVDSLKILRGVSAVADQGVLETLRGWRYRPMQIDGRPVPFCYANRFLFSVER